ncbi:MAG TPA: T9SS type A sorting domain-containing protein, partial [Prolixibacteraceae bacterium]|nr:T9SS type A sorting domain-containing protein [Prolixibacteraceae bacterium]
VQDRGNWGSGHGWAGVTQVVWNCRSPKTAVQSPWVSGKNYCIGLTGGKYAGRLSGRPDGEWEGLNQPGLLPESLYDAQLKSRLLTTGISQQAPAFRMEVYPNPSRGIINVDYQGAELTYNFYAMDGSKLRSGKISGNPCVLHLENYADGLYLLECFAAGETSSQKVIIQR